jgi:poly(hydroxyalkanoate) depolymerase family esterase
MIFNKNMRARMHEATRKLMSDSALAATTAIQKALKEMPTRMGKTLSDPKDIPDFMAALLGRLDVALPKDDCKVNQYLWDPKPQVAPIPKTDADENKEGQFLTKSFTNHAGTREYKVYIPSSYHGQLIPVIVMLHGCTQNPDDFARGTRMNAIADRMQCVVVYPAQSHSANSSKCWNWFKAANQQRDQGEPSIIAGITRQVLSDYQLDSKRVYVAGLSSGGAMAIIMGTTYPDIYTAVGVHSGLPYGSAHDLPSAFAAMRGTTTSLNSKTSSRDAALRLRAIPIIVFHGDSDTTVNARNADELIKQNVLSEQTSASATADRIALDVIIQEGKVSNGHHYTRTSHHNLQGLVAEHWLIHGAGHSWSGGSPSGRYTDAKGPDASEEMIRFFFTRPTSL